MPIKDTESQGLLPLIVEPFIRIHPLSMSIGNIS
jgi:hypothetical protein